MVFQSGRRFLNVKIRDVMQHNGIGKVSMK
jgi:hypothetical protein